MFYDVQIHAPEIHAFPTIYESRTALQMQNLLDSYLKDGLNGFTFVVTRHVHAHQWVLAGQDAEGAAILDCAPCSGSFTISQSLLTACFEGELRAQREMLA